MDELNWNEYWKIAEYLEKAFPDTDVLNLTREGALRLVRRIPNFSDTLTPSDTVVDSLIYSWLDLRNGTEGDTTV